MSVLPSRAITDLEPILAINQSAVSRSLSPNVFSPIQRNLNVGTLIALDNLIRTDLLLFAPHSDSHYSRVIYNAQHPHHHRLPHTLNQASDHYGSPSTNDFATYQNYASTASTVSTLAQFNYNNPESYPYTPTTPLTMDTDISANTPSTTTRRELSASALAAVASSSATSLAGSGGGGGCGNRLARSEKDGGRQSVKDAAATATMRSRGRAGEADDDEASFASIRIQVRLLCETVPYRY